jgi:superfamily I DNA/RNA helicase
MFSRLNKSQEQAVATIEGPVLIVAGPGTGKTLTIVQRIIYLIHRGVKPENILAVTFTNRAARQMIERTEELLGKDAQKVFIGTFHILGLKILRDASSNNFTIINRDEQVNLLRALIKDSGMKVQHVVEKISRIKNLIEDIEDADDSVKIYKKYQETLAEKNALDLDDLILRPIDILREISGKYKNIFEYIMVDEYQDINPAQYKLLNLLTKNNRNLCVVGDSDQAIYAFRGADITNFLNFEKDFENSQKIVLTQNYRSTAIILEASNHLIRSNLKRIEKELRPVKKQGVPVKVLSIPDEKTEGEVVIKEIEERIGGTSHYQLIHKTTGCNHSEASYSFGDFAVFFRTNAQAKVLEESFLLSGIPFHVIGRAHQFKRNEIVEIMKKRSQDLRKELSFDEFLNKVLEESGLIKYFEESALLLLRSLASHYRDAEPSEAINGFINELDLLTPADTYDPKADAVTLATLHMAKGLEFRVVFITGVEEGLIPYTMKKDSTDIEEERRLFYVGMTRAKDELFLIHARNRFLYGQKLERSPSPFLREIPERFIEQRFIPEKRQKIKKENQIGLF